MVNTELFKNNALVRIRVPGIIGNTRKVKVTDAMVAEATGPLPDNMPEDEKARRKADAKRRLGVNKKLIVCKELDAAASAIAAAKSEVLRAFCNPSFIDQGWYLIRLDRVSAFEQRIADLNKDGIVPAVRAFADVLPVEIERAKVALGNAFNASDYPTPDKVRQYPGIGYGFVQFTVPEGLPPEVREQEEKKLREQFAQAQNQIVGALWEEFGELIAHLKDRLEPGADGKAKTFQKSTVENLTAFIEAFQNRNAFNDAKLAAVVERAKGILDSVGEDAANKLRNFDEVRAQTRDAFGSLKIAVDQAITELPGRAFSFEE